MTDFKVGYTFSSNTSGSYEVEALLKGGKAIIRFHQTGNVRLADIKHMKTGEVSDALAYRTDYLPKAGSEIDWTLGGDNTLSGGAVTLDSKGNLTVYFAATSKVDENLQPL
ncbi:hypothetical protein [Pantoea vagans]|uniref:hypothetical protein n=1 Tax=Pantoea vagans TaxID=470934 RepID=UPI000660285F|nr:hypothetical protein [Pantoea vagans]